MKFKFLFIFLLFFILSCSNNSLSTLETKKSSTEQSSEKKNYSSSGFTLIYNKSLIKKKIIKKKLNNSKYEILHSFLKPNTFVKIYNPRNSLNIVAKVKYKTELPKIYNSVITDRIAKALKIDPNEPFVEILEIKKNYKFIAKKAKTFDEEKKVANIAPVTDINVKNISSTDNSSLKKKNAIYFIKISDFYYKDSANILIDNLKNTLNMNTIKLKEINKNKFRVYSGPYKSFNLMKDDYFLILSYGFEQLDVTTKN